MSSEAKVRISKVRFRNGTELTILDTPEPPDENGSNGSFVETLVYLLSRARKGEALGYAMVFLLENANGGVSTIEAADVQHVDGQDKLTLLGAMRQMEQDFMQRTMPASSRFRTGGDDA